MMKDREIEDLIHRGGSEDVHTLVEALLKSNWPDCDRYANALLRIGSGDAITGLKKALKGRRHHIRSAAIKALSSIGGSDIREAIATLANDSAYEVRQDVTEALRLLDRGKE